MADCLGVLRFYRRDIILARRYAWLCATELSMGWVDPWVGLDWVEIFQFLVGWVASTIVGAC